jgi:betaine-aldehyde dehydrogenase
MAARLCGRNSGKPIVEAEYDIADVATCFEYYGGMATKITGHVNPVPDNALSLSMKEPVGVAGQIIPWNYPLLMAAWKLAPALAAGCTCVLKPAEQTPLTALEMAAWFPEVGLPDGVVNIITGLGESTGAPLVRHPDVNKIAFTGSAEVGKIIMKSAADTVKRVTLELGGKSPIFSSPTRILKRRSTARCLAYSSTRAKCAPRAAASWWRKKSTRNLSTPWPPRRKPSVWAPPLERETKMGPLVSKDQYDRVRSYQELGKKKPRSPTGGGRAAHLDRGFYVEPTIFYDVDNSARIAQEEIFGPVAAVIPFADEAEAIRIANATPYGLGRGGVVPRHFPRVSP